MSDKRAHEEYENKYFGFSAKEFALSTEVLIKDSISKVLQDFVVQFKAKGGVDVSLEMQKFNNDCTTHVDNCMTNITAFANEHFAIPDNVLLSGDEIQRTQYTEDEEVQMDTEIEKFERQLKNEYYMDYRFQEELQRKSSITYTTIKKLENSLMTVDDNLNDNKVEENEEILKIILGTIDKANGRCSPQRTKDYIFDNLFTK